MSLSKYIEYRVLDDQHDPSQYREVHEMLEWFASTPEGVGVLEEALRLHGKPLEVFVDDRFDSGAGYMQIPGISDHALMINLERIKAAQFMSESGELSPLQPKRAIAHECFHAAQEGLQETASEYCEIQDQINKQVAEPYWQKVFGHMRFYANKEMSENELIEVAKDAYNAHMAGHENDMQEEFINRLNAHPVAKRLIEEFERPTLEFENKMAAAYALGPPTSEDYLERSNRTFSEEELTMMRAQALADIVRDYREDLSNRLTHWRDLIASGQKRNQSPAFEIRGRT